MQTSGKKQKTEHTNNAYLFIDHDLRVVKKNKAALAFFDDTVKVTDTTELTELFPAVKKHIKQIHNIVKGKNSDLTIHNLMSKKSNQRITTFSMKFFRTDKEHTPIRVQLRKEKDSFLKKGETENDGNVIKAAMENTFLDDAILGKSMEIQKIRKNILTLAQYPELTLLLEGESGTGKNLIAKILHYSSMGSDKPFVEVNCAAIPESLIESELFGHRKGTFTHATSDKKGLLEAADGGTLFLNEITETPYFIQAKLLTFLESKSFRPLGDTKEIEVSVRLISATNKNMLKMVKKGKFREDLFYRLNVVHMELPPLRSLGDDLFLLASHFIDIYNLKYNKKVKQLSSSAKDLLREHIWNGNIRELRNVIERAVVFADSDTIKAENIEIHYKSDKAHAKSFPDSISLPTQGISFEKLERKILSEALKMADGNQTKAAKLLQLSRETFRYRVEKYNLR